MHQRFVFTVFALGASMIFSGCGGGGAGAGSTGESSANNSVTLSGTAAKGMLMGADVSAYAVMDGQPSKTALARTQTNRQGEYTLNLPPHKGPVIVEVKANASTTMRDETQILADGTFAEVMAPANLTMRSFAGDVTQTVIVRVNPYTEMAVAVAANTGAVNLNSLIAGQQIAQLATPEGVNPFSQAPTEKPGDMDESQLKFSLQMAGLLGAAKGNSACDLNCQVTDLSKNVKLTLNSEGKATVPGETLLAIRQKKESVLSTGSNALKVEPNQQSRLNQIKTAVQTEAKDAVSKAQAQKGESSQTASPAEVVAANGLDGFVKSMRDGFRLTETRLLRAEEDLVKRYENVTLDGVSFVGKVLDAIGDDCDAEVMVCSSRPASSFRWTGSNGNYTWVNAVPDSLGRTSSGTVLGVKGEGGKSVVRINGQISKNGQQLVVMRDIALSLIEGGDDNFMATIQGTIQAKDSASNLTIDLSLEDLRIQSSVVKFKEMANVSFKGGLSLVASNGDNLRGSLDIKMVEVRRKIFYGSDNQWWYEDYDEYVTDGVIQLKAVTNASGTKMDIFELDVQVAASQPDYMRPVGPGNVETYSGTVKLALADKLTTLVFNESASNWQTVNQTATIQSGGSEVRLSVAYALNNPSGAWCQWQLDVRRCANELKLTSTNANPYTATLTKGSNGKTKGDIFLGTTKVGEIVNGVLKINGSEVSLY